MTTGQKVKYLRENASLSQLELAEKLGLKQCTISKLEHGEIIPSVPTLVKISKVFKCSVAELLEEEAS